MGTYSGGATVKHELRITWESKTEVELIDPKQIHGTSAHKSYIDEISEVAMNLVGDLIDIDVLKVEVELRSTTL